MISSNAPTARHRRNIPRNTNRSSTSTTGTTRALIERSRSANSRNFQVIPNKESGSSTAMKGSSSTAKRGVFTKANERKKRNISSKTNFNKPSTKAINVASTSGSDKTAGNVVNDALQMNFIDINNVNDIMDDKDLTETNIDDEMIGNASLKSRINNMTVEFIGCSPKHENYLDDEYNFIQTLPRSYKVQNRRNEEGSLTIENGHDDNVLSRFDMSKSVKSILTVQEKLTQDFPSLPPQVISFCS